ncbi:MAG: hypothetical protein AAFR61_02535 [Bacteroidota bacterium]
MNLHRLWICLFTLWLNPVANFGQSDPATAREVAFKFAEAVCQPVDWQTIKQLYPDFCFTSVAKGRRFSILSFSQEGVEVLVEVRTSWTVEGKARYRDFTLKLWQTSQGWKVINSLYLAYLPQTQLEELAYAAKQGWVQPGEILWDQERHALIKRARQASRNP